MEKRICKMKDRSEEFEELISELQITGKFALKKVSLSNSSPTLHSPLQETINSIGKSLYDLKAKINRFSQRK